MSIVSQGEGWWLASDGRWYAPEQHPDFGTVPATPTSPPAAAAGRAAPVKPERIIPLDAPLNSPTARTVSAQAAAAGEILPQEDAPAVGSVPPPPAMAPPVADGSPVPPPMIDGTHMMGTAASPPGASRRAVTDTYGASNYGGSSVGTSEVKVNNPRGVSIVMVGFIIIVLGLGAFIAHHFLYPPSPHRSPYAVASDILNEFYNDNQKAVNADLEPGQTMLDWSGLHTASTSTEFIRLKKDPDNIDTDVVMIVCFNTSGSTCNAQSSGSVTASIPVHEIHKKWYVDAPAVVQCGSGNIVCYNPNI